MYLETELHIVPWNMFQGTRCYMSYLTFVSDKMPHSKFGVKRAPVDAESMKNAVQAVTAPPNK